MREYIAAVVKRHCRFRTRRIVMADSDNGKKIENTRFGVWSEAAERGGNVSWRDKVESRFRIWAPHPGGLRFPAPHGYFARLGRMGREEVKATLDDSECLSLSRGNGANLREVLLRGEASNTGPATS